MKPIFIYYNNLNFDQNKRFILEFSDDDRLEGVLFKKNKDYYITSISCYVDLTADVTELPQFYKIKEVLDLSNVILADGVDLGYKKNAIQTTYEGENYMFKIDKINWSKYIDNIEFFDVNLKKKKVCICLFTLQRIRR